MNKPVAIITGAGRGIGKEIAEVLAQRDHALTLVSRSAVAESTAHALVVPADVSLASDIDEIVKATLEKFGRIDVLVNNAGFAPVRSIEQMTHDEWRSVIDTNLSSVFYLCKAVWPTFRKQNAGVIVNISSMAARSPFAGLTAYGAAKAGLNLLGFGLAREGAEFGIRVHTIAPGAVETQMLRAFMPEEQFPREKTLDPAEIARIVGQCVAGDLRYTSGEVIWVHKTM